MSEEVWDEIEKTKHMLRGLRGAVRELSERVDGLAKRLEALEGEDQAEAGIAERVEAVATATRFLGSGR